jgi:hypothetical protein
MQADRAIDEIEAVLKEVEPARAASPHRDLSGGLPQDDLRRIRTRLAAAVDRLSPNGSRYARDAQEILARGSHHGVTILELVGVLKALKADLGDGYLLSIEELVHGAVFDDFLEMAAELADKGYKVPAAVLSGAVMEEHVRKLAARSGLRLDDTRGKPKSFDTLTIELVKAGHFSEPQRKILIGWYGQRSEAAHGRPENVIEADLPRMIEGIRDFMVRFPA